MSVKNQLDAVDNQMTKEREKLHKLQEDKKILLEKVFLKILSIYFFGSNLNKRKIKKEFTSAIFFAEGELTQSESLLVT